MFKTVFSFHTWKLRSEEIKWAYNDSDMNGLKESSLNDNV